MENNIEIVKQSENTNYESQVDIAKRYPRDLKRCINNSIVVATMDKETSELCGYVLPRAGKKLHGPSVHLAKIIVQNYGNIRVESRVIEVKQREVIAEAIAFDLETNIASRREERKSIFGKHGRYSDDMIIVTGKAAAAIAYRNAIFDIIPRSIIDKVYKESMNFLTGDLSSETELIKRRKKAIDSFNDDFGVKEDEVLKSLGLNTINQIKQQEIITLIGMYNALKNSESSVDEMFNRKPEVDLKDGKLNTPKPSKNE